jgi:hypothetical protein
MREGAKRGVTRLDRIKRGSGIKGRDDRSNGIEIHIADDLAKINPTDPLILAKQAARRNLNCSDSSGISLTRAEASRWVCRNRALLTLVEGRGACGSCSLLKRRQIPAFLQPFSEF